MTNPIQPTALTPAIIVRAWKDPKFARSLPTALQQQLPPNPAGRALTTTVSRAASEAHENSAASSYSSECYSTKCYSTSCYSTSCYSTSCYSTSCYSTSCYSTSCYSTDCHSAHCHSAYCPTGAKLPSCGKKP